MKVDNNQIAVEIFSKHADAYNEKHFDVSLYASSLNFVAERLADSATVLDLACGPGNITNWLLRHKPGLQILGIDMSAAMIELAIQNNKSATFEVRDVRKISEINSTFNAVICGFCLPYLNQPEAQQVIEDASRLLPINGMLYLSTIEGNYNQSSIKTSSAGDQLYMYYYDEALLSNILQNNSLIIDHLDRKKYVHNEEEITDIIIVARKIA